MDYYLVITPNEVSHHATAVSALEACGMNQWETALPAMKLREIEPGDSFNLDPNRSVVKLSGKEFDYNG